MIDVRASVERIILQYGEPVEYTPQGGSTLFVTASVQVPVSADLINDFDMTSFIVYMRPSDLPAPPQKFDRISIRGQVRGIEEVQVERVRGEVAVYIVRTRG